MSDLYYQKSTANDYAITSDGGTNYIPLYLWFQSTKLHYVI